MYEKIQLLKHLFSILFFNIIKLVTTGYLHYFSVFLQAFFSHISKVGDLSQR